MLPCETHACFTIKYNGAVKQFTAEYPNDCVKVLLW